MVVRRHTIFLLFVQEVNAEAECTHSHLSVSLDAQQSDTVSLGL